MITSATLPRSDSRLYWTLVVFLALAFLMGGGAREDIQSLVILRPASVLCVAIGLWGMRSEQVTPFRFLLAFGGACVLLVLSHLIPLPPAIWTTLPGRALAEETTRIAGLDQLWRPLSLVPFRTWNGLLALVVPIAALLLAIRCTREQRFSLLSPLIAFGLVSGFVGLLQAISPSSGMLYLYRITNNGMPVGLFANRNHQAILLACLFPMLAVYASQELKSIKKTRLRRWLAAGAGAAIVPLILITGSRSGVLLGLLGLATVPALYQKPGFGRPADRMEVAIGRNVVGAAIVGGLGAVTFLLARARALERLTGADPSEDLRWAIWPSILKITAHYFPYGSGMGTFVEIYQIEEPQRLLATQYVNHAHNDWIEMALTGGLPAILLLVVAVTAWCLKASRLVKLAKSTSRDVQFAKLGAVLTLLIAVGSLVDYPLRVPSLAVLFAIAAVWMSAAVPPSSAAPIPGRE